VDSCGFHFIYLLDNCKLEPWQDAWLHCRNTVSFQRYAQCIRLFFEGLPFSIITDIFTDAGVCLGFASQGREADRCI
jgi:hypothetical protein